ncbi:hypothetical protein SDC9_211091 [bioreactor metagenome]|uniref:Uncharacterized protein n=1 Tax=bioreactor metagenome TaxID=1076179 RepID=A0A645JVU3_9ZZZZ
MNQSVLPAQFADDGFVHVPFGRGVEHGKQRRVVVQTRHRGELRRSPGTLERDPD